LADDSLNPQDKAELNELKRGLHDVGDRLEKALARAERAARDVEQVETRKVARDAREESRARAAARGPVISEQGRGPRPAIIGQRTERTLPELESTLSAEKQLGIERVRNLQTLQRELDALQQRSARQQLALPRAGQTGSGASGSAFQMGPATGPGVPYTRGAGGGGGGRPPLPPAPPGGGEPPDRGSARDILGNARVQQAQAREGEANAEEQEKLQRALRRSATEEAQLNARVSESSRTLAINSNALRAHGALTTEFITAAAKGQTTFRELGFQVGATIGKFAGWTAAATAVYGALGAVTQFKDGAIDTLEGVNHLQRVVDNLNTEQAQRQFRALALEFNLPIKTVVDTAYEASKAFKDQNDAMEATRAALFAVKVGELDAGKAGQFATAVVRGFHLEASELGNVIDTVNALQNKFGGNFGQIAQGMAQAAGAFGAAGGNYRELAAAISTVSQVTGIPGANAATALRRTSELAFRPERRQNILDVLGLDTRDSSTTISDLIQAAMQKVAKGANPLEIAKLITTPELASRAIAPLLASGALYNQRLAVAERPGPSSQRELERARQSFRNEVSRVGVEIQALGSNLAQSGALNAAGGLLKTVNTTLGLMNSLLELFNQLPKPVREASVYFAQIAAAMALMRRFDVGATVSQRFPTIGPVFGRRPESAARAQLFQGLGDERSFLQEQGRTVGRQRALAESAAARDFQRHAAVQDLHAAGRVSDAEVIASHQRLGRLQANARALSEEQADVQARINENMRQETAIRRRTSIRQREGVAAAAAAEGVTYTNPTLNRNVPVRAVPIAGPIPEAVPTSGQYTAPIGPVTAGVAREGEAAEELARNRNSLRRALEEERALWARGIGTEGAMSRTLGTVSGTMLFAKRGTENTAAALKGFGASMKEFIGDPFIALTAGFLIAEASYSYVRDKIQQTQRAKERFESLAGSGRSTAQIRDQTQAELSHTTPFEHIQNAFATGATFLSHLPGGYGRTFVSPDQQRDADARKAARDANQIDTLNQAGKGLTRDQITARLNESLKAAGGNQDAINKAFHDAYDSADLARGVLFAKDDKAYQKALAAVAAYKEALKQRRITMQAVAGNIDEALGAVTDAGGLGRIIAAVSNRADLYGLTPRDASDLGKTRARGVELIANLDKSDPKYDEQFSAILQQMDAATAKVVDKASEELQDVLISATPREAHAARQRAIAKVRAATVGGQQADIRRIQARMRDRSREIDKAQEDALVQHGENLVRSDVGFAGADAVAGLGAEGKKQAHLRGLKAAQKGDQAKIDALRKSMGMTRREFQQFVREQEQTEFDLQTALEESQTADPVEQAAIAARRAQQGVERARAGRGNKPLVQALTERNQARIGKAQADYQRFQQQQQLEQARQEAGGAGDEAVLRSNISRAQEAVAYLKGKGKLIDPAVLAQAQISVYQAQKALADFLESSATSLIDAQESLALSRTEDPIKQAQIKVDAARKRLAEARTPEDRMTKQADLNNKIRERRNTAQQERFDDITFMADMGQIGKQTEIAMLQTLLTTMHGNRDLRRQIRRTIYDLQHQTNDLDSGDLTLGNIRLPTPYEVNRAIKEGGRAARGGHTFNTRAEVNVYVARAEDAPAVADSIDSVLNTHVRSVLRTRTP
jgi:TP901 family phage tail tape measure protein